MTVLVSDTGKEPVLKQAGDVLSIDVDNTRQAFRQTEHKLHELARYYYLFSVAPVYVVTGFDQNLVELYLREVGALDAECIMFISRATTPIFAGNSEWCRQLIGLPWQVVQGKIDPNKNLFRVFTAGVEFVDRRKGANDYWTIEAHTVSIFTPGIVSEPTQVDIYTPSGYDYRLVPSVARDRSIVFTKAAPSNDVRARALALLEAGL